MYQNLLRAPETMLSIVAAYTDRNWRKAWNGQIKANGKHIFPVRDGLLCSDIPVEKFGLLLKTVCLFRKFSGQSSLNNLTISVPTRIFG